MNISRATEVKNAFFATTTLTTEETPVLNQLLELNSPEKNDKMKLLCVCTTRWLGGSPTITPSGQDGKEYHRLEIPLDQIPPESSLFISRKTLEAFGPNDVKIQKIIVAVARNEEEKQHFSRSPNYILLDKARNDFFYYNEVEKKWFSNDYYDPNFPESIEYRYFVYILLGLNSFQEAIRHEWDKVTCSVGLFADLQVERLDLVVYEDQLPA